MGKVRGLVFTRPFTAVHGRRIGKLLFGDSALFISDFKGRETPDLMEAFYRHYNGISKTRLDKISNHVPIDEVIARCRLLRKWERRRSERMVWAMSLSINEILDRFEPDFVLGLCLDNYVLDILERLQRARGIPGTYPMESAFPNLTRITSRGEHAQVREPSAQEVDAVIDDVGRPTFKPLWLSKPKGVKDIVRIQLREYGKKAYSAFQRWKNSDPLSFHYNASIMSEGSKLAVLRWHDADWEEKARSSGRPTIFFPLQFAPETTLDYYIDDLSLIDYERAVRRTLQVLGRRFTVFVKEHPDMYGYRGADFYRMIRSSHNAILVPVEVPVQRIIDRSDAVVVYAGATVGIQARLQNKPLVAIAQSYYSIPEEMGVAGSYEGIERLPALIESAPVQCDKRRFIRRILANTLPGRYNFVWLDETDPEQNRHVDTVADAMRDGLLDSIRPVGA